jgi:putative membrane protein
VAHRARLKHPHQRYVLILAGVFALFWTALAIAPVDRADWMLENGLVVVILALLALTYRRFPFSRVSYTLIFVFLCLHEIGAHYTYAKVPYDAWFQALTGRTLNSLFGATRNHFDRLGHFAFGLLLSYPMREIFVRVAEARGFWSYYLPLDMTMACSMVFELIEWAAAVAFGGDLGVAYLGTQGDQWDAQKDMLLATLGGLIAMIVTAVINMHQERDFAREWIESLRVKSRAPLDQKTPAR